MYGCIYGINSVFELWMVRLSKRALCLRHRRRIRRHCLPCLLVAHTQCMAAVAVAAGVVGIDDPRRVCHRQIVLRTSYCCRCSCLHSSFRYRHLRVVHSHGHDIPSLIHRDCVLVWFGMPWDLLARLLLRCSLEIFVGRA